MANQASAKKVYTFKVCTTYLKLSGKDAKGCDAAFDNLITNMTAGYKALATPVRTGSITSPHW